MVDNKQKHVAQRRRGGRADLRPIDVDEDVTEKRKSKSLNANLPELGFWTSAQPQRFSSSFAETQRERSTGKKKSGVTSPSCVFSTLHAQEKMNLTSNTVSISVKAK